MPSSNAIARQQRAAEHRQREPAAAREERAAGEAGAGGDGHARLDAAQATAGLRPFEKSLQWQAMAGPQEVW